MSTRCAFMSSRPSSNTANRPIGPAPMMRASVLIGSLSKRSIFIGLASGAPAPLDDHCDGCLAAGSSREKTFPGELSTNNPRVPGTKRLAALVGWRAHHEPVQFLSDLNLARQTRVRLGVVGEVEHVLFHRRGFAGLFDPRFVDVDMAGGAGAGPAALRPDSGGPRVYSGFNDQRGYAC